MGAPQDPGVLHGTARSASAPASAPAAFPALKAFSKDSTCAFPWFKGFFQGFQPRVPSAFPALKAFPNDSSHAFLQLSLFERFFPRIPAMFSLV